MASSDEKHQAENVPLLVNAWSSAAAPAHSPTPLSPPTAAATAAAAVSPASAPPAALAVQSGLPQDDHRTPWGFTAGLLLADMFGVGCIGLPGVFQRLGWLLSFTLLVLFSLGCGYLGVLFSKLAVALPQAQTFDDIGGAALGHMGRRLVYACVYTTILADPIALHITCLFAIKQVFVGLGTGMASLIVGLVMLPLAQIQSIHDVAWLGLAATACMVGAVFATLIRVLALAGDQLAATSLLPPPTTRAIEGLIASLQMSFAFGGQVNWMRYMTSMAHREEFKYAAEVADGTMSVFYVLLSATAYAKLGNSFDPSLPITSVLPPGLVTRLINLALLLRCLVAYTLNANVFTDLALRVGRPWLSRLEEGSGLGRRASWGLVSATCVACAGMVAWAVPCFDLVIAIIAAVGDIAAPYTLPCLFALVLLPGLCRAERALLRTLVPVSALLAAFGLYAASYRLVEVLTSR